MELRFSVKWSFNDGQCSALVLLMLEWEAVGIVTVELSTPLLVAWLAVGHMTQAASAKAQSS